MLILMIYFTTPQVKCEVYALVTFVFLYVLFPPFWRKVCNPFIPFLNPQGFCRCGGDPWRLSSQIQFLKNLIPVILLDPQIAARDCKRGVIVDIHQHHFRHVVFPRMISECLTQ